MQLLKAPFLVYLVVTVFPEVINDTKGILTVLNNLSLYPSNICLDLQEHTPRNLSFL